MNQPVTPASSPKSVCESGADVYAAEVRFGVVMYGGVSLAIYMNGVTNELFEMACATPRDGNRIVDQDEPFTREIYRRVSWLMGNWDLRNSYAAAIEAARLKVSGQDPEDTWNSILTGGYSQTRLAIDVIAGTSAGGINGVFLAKALANGEQFGGLKDLWVNEGDMGLLLNDAPSYDNVSPSIANRSGKPESLLNSDRMYAKLYSALSRMPPLKGVQRPRGDDGSPLAEEIDLYVTTTDIRGSAVPLRLFDKVVYERRYKQSFHFRYPDGVTPKGNDFADVNTPFLAFASRCTSSFPFAFEPMTLSAVTRMKIDDGTPGVLRWNDFFPHLPRAEVTQGLHVHRAFGDGGYLDNKPFSYVVDTLSRRFSAVPIERKLIFVEPSPEKLDPHEMPEVGNAPDALENSLAALTTIPRYESIREDLQAVLLRNRRIERIERVVRLGELSVNPTDAFSVRISEDGQIPNWSTLKLSDMIAYYGTAFLPYQRLRVYAVTDRLADRLGSKWDIDADSDQQYALRALVRVWRERNFSDEGNGKPTINAFLDEFDVDYRVRRLAFLLRKTDQLIRLFHRRTLGTFDVGEPEPGAPRLLSEEETQLLGALPSMFLRLSSNVQVSTVAEAEKVLLCIKCGLLRSYVRLLTESRRLDCKVSLDAIDEKIRRDLNVILLLVLGQTPDDQSLEVAAADAGGTVHVILKPEALRMASATRTLQEGVAFRAAALFESAESVAATPLQRMLVEGIQSMRVKADGREPGQDETSLHIAAGLGWHVLGKPELTIDKSQSRVDVTVHDVAAREPYGPDDFCLDQLNSEVGHALRTFLSHYYLRFDTYDQMSFPLYYDTATGEPSIVEVVRVSPVDAKNLIDEETDPLQRRKLAGTALGNFGAFLDHRWRLNDIMWGRLDGAERLIQALLPMRDTVTSIVRKELIERAQRSILRESLVPEGNASLLKMLEEALLAMPGPGSTPEKVNTLLETLGSGNAAARAQLSSVLTSLLSEPGLMHYVRHDRKLDPEPDPESTMKSASRAVTITGRILEGISKRHKVGKAVPRWLARLGLMLQGIVAVSLPGTLNQRWWTHGVKVLYAFEALLFVFALFLGSSDMRSLAVTGFAATLGIHLVSLIAGDVIREQRNWIRGLVAFVLVALLLLAGLGGVVLFHQATQQAMCWSNPASGEQRTIARWVCERIHGVQAHWNDASTHSTPQSADAVGR